MISIDKQVIELPALGLVRWAIQSVGSRFAVVTSFQAEGMVITDMALRADRSARILTIDTGRLPAETLAVIAEVEQRYGITVEIVRPDPDEVEGMTTRWGADLFLDSPAHRSLCCEIRKVRPFARALERIDIYATGLRREQNTTRADIAVATPDGERVKLAPLAAWTKADVDRYTREHNLPVHPLYAAGYASIGCAPCTRAIEPGATERSGRWWWEQGSAKECGLHFKPGGGVERTVDVLLREVLTR